MNRFLCVGLLSLSLVVMSGAAHPLVAPAQTTLPSYDFQVGDEYRYTFDFQMQNGDTTYGTVGDWKLFVVDKLSGRRWRMVLRQATKSFQKRGVDRYEEPERASYMSFVIDASGRLELSENLVAAVRPAMLLPGLPVTARELSHGWRRAQAYSGETHDYTFIAKDAGFEIADHLISDVNRAAGGEVTMRFWFDGKRGLPQRIEIRNEQQQAHGKTVLEFKHRQKLDADVLARLRVEIAALETAIFAHLDKAPSYLLDAKSLDEKLDAALGEIQSTADAFTIDELKKQLTLWVETQRRQRQLIRDTAERRAAVVGKPAADWKATVIADGKATPETPKREICLADYKGRVRVLAFWYRGSGWCIKMLQALRSLTRDYHSRDVSFIGMTIDKDPQDVEFVYDMLGLDFPTIAAKPIDVDYHVRTYPTTIVIDRHGIVREYVMGFDVRFERRLAQIIDAALADDEPPQPKDAGSKGQRR